MKRKATKTTRGPNALEKAFQGWLKEQPCATCNKPGPSIVNHAMGSTYKHNKTLIGHIFCNSLCEFCDSIITLGSRRSFINRFGLQSDIWRLQAYKFIAQTSSNIPEEVMDAIMDCRQ